jgi:antimicrobial peptide system SdpB family protein
MLTALGQRARAWVSGTQPWTNVYGLARTVLALGTAGTLLFSHSTSLFRPGARVPEVPQCAGVRQASLFCLVPSDSLEVARWLAVILLLVVASGWRPRVTGLLHWWVTASLSVSALLLDGGDQVAAVLSFLLVPLALTDPRRWHWSAPPPPQAEPRDEQARLVAHSSHLATRLQMAGIYLHASVGKLKVEEWADGTALYYWMTNNLLGVPNWLQQMLMPLLTRPVVALLTWGVLVFEFLLFMALTFDRPARRLLLPLGIGFHLTIMVAYGLTSFFASMSAGLILLLRPLDEPFNFEPVWSRLKALVPQRTKGSSASVGQA